MATASILTIGNELVSGDVPNTNASWLAKRLAPLGVETRLHRGGARRDRADRRGHPPRGAARRLLHRRPAASAGRRTTSRARRSRTPSACRRRRCPSSPRICARDSRAIPSTRRGGRCCRAAPGRSRTRSAARPDSRRERLRPAGPAVGDGGDVRRRLGGVPCAAARSARWRRMYRTRESVIAPALVEAGERWPGVLVGSYPTFGSGRPERRGGREVERPRRARRRVGVARSRDRRAQLTAGRRRRSRT